MYCLKNMFILFINLSKCFAKESIDFPKTVEGNGNDSTKAELYMEAKIVGGEYARLGQFPYAVYVASYCILNSDEYFSCGSSVLTQRLLITAGHCVQDCKGNFHISTYAGSPNFERSKVIREVNRYAIHSAFDASTLENDIALLLVRSDLPLSSNIKRLLIRRSFPQRVTGVIAGWGLITDFGTTSSMLKAVSQTVLSFKYCEKRVSQLTGTFCASNANKDYYPYEGDSGSGLVIDNHQLIGVVSYREDSYPDIIIYSNVSYYYKWIVEKSKLLYCYEYKSKLN